MSAADLVRLFLLGLGFCLPLPLAAWGVCAWKRASRGVLLLAIPGAGLLNLAAGLFLLRATRPERGAYQHSSAGGMLDFWAYAGLGACQLLALALVPALALGRRPGRPVP